MASSAVHQQSSKTETYVDNKRKDNVLQANIFAARTVADTVRTSLGPKGMGKMISTASGEVSITNDGATILNKMEVLQLKSKPSPEARVSIQSASMATAAVHQPRSSKTETYVDNKRKDDVRQANIVAARTVSDSVRTSLGPKGMDKRISTASGEVIITNDGDYEVLIAGGGAIFFH